MDQRRTLRHFLENTAPPVVTSRGPVSVEYDQPVVIMPGHGSAPLEGRPTYPGAGMPERMQDRETLANGWPRLARGGQALGKSSDFLYDATATNIQKGIEVARIEGSDLDATQVIITLGQPAIALVDLADLDDQVGAQTIQAFSSNDEVDPDAIFPGTATPPSWAPLTAWIQWGVGGYQSQMFVDWVQGAKICVTGSFVSVTPVAMPDAINRPGQSALYKCGANIGPGFGQSVAKRTVFTEGVASGDSSVAYPVPPMARRATVIGLDDGTPVIANGYLRFWQRSTPADNVGTVFFNTNQPIAFNVPNASTYFTVKNGTGSAQAFAVIFELD